MKERNTINCWDRRTRSTWVCVSCDINVYKSAHIVRHARSQCSRASCVNIKSNGQTMTTPSSSFVFFVNDVDIQCKNRNKRIRKYQKKRKTPFIPVSCCSSQSAAAAAVMALRATHATMKDSNWENLWTKYLEYFQVNIDVSVFFSLAWFFFVLFSHRSVVIFDSCVVCCAVCMLDGKTDR